MKDFESNEEFAEFCKLFDESDKELFENVRFALDREFKDGWGHNTVYNIDQFKNGTLDALEGTRRGLACKSAEELIDLLHTLGYADKRVMYIIWKLGYYNISFRDFRKYKRDNKIKLQRLQKEYLEKMNEKKIELFQIRQQEVLQTESKTLSIYLDNIATCQEELKADPRMVLDEPSKFKRLTRTIDTLQAQVDAMHAVTKKRDASININMQLAIAEGLAKQKTTIEGGTTDNPLSLDSSNSTSLIE